MTNSELTGSIKALLDEYKRAVNELIAIIKPLNSNLLLKVVDDKTNDPDCKSIQAILSHVVCSGYGYTIYMENSIGFNKPRLEREMFDEVNRYIERLELMFEYTENFFRSNPGLIIEQKDNSKKITVNWGQQYDIEQLFEHAIVHVLRHRRQIENLVRTQSERTV